MTIWVGGCLKCSECDGKPKQFIKKFSHCTPFDQGGGGQGGSLTLSSHISKSIHLIYFKFWYVVGLGLPVCQIWKLYNRSYGLNSQDIGYRAFSFSIQVVLGVPYILWKFESNDISCCRDGACQSLGEILAPWWHTFWTKLELRPPQWHTLWTALELPPPPPPPNHSAPIGHSHYGCARHVIEIPIALFPLVKNINCMQYFSLIPNCQKDNGLTPNQFSVTFN